MNRQLGSATRAFTDEALAAAGVEQGAVVGYREEVSTPWAVALRILRGEADVGVATRAVAAALSLGFVPLARAVRPRDPEDAVSISSRHPATTGRTLQSCLLL